MNDDVRSAVEALVSASEAAFASKRDEAVAAFERCGSCDGEIVDCFNAILGAGNFKSTTGSSNVAFDGDEREAHRAMCVAAVLHEIGEQKGLTRSQKGREPKRLGWSNLNRDAKGWCKAMLECSVPEDIPPAALKDLLRAKSYVGCLVDEELVESLRDVMPRTKGNTLGANSPVDD